MSRYIRKSLFPWAGALLLGGCAAAVETGGSNLGYTRDVEAAFPVRSILERRYTTVVRQQFDFSCGSAALATLLRFHYNEPVDERITFAGMWRDGDQAQIRKLGFSFLDMKRFLAAHNLAADGYRVSLDEIAKAQLPGIALITVFGYRHFVVVKGVEPDSVLLGDPALGLRRVSRHEFTKSWNGILFAINNRADYAKTTYNRTVEQALAPGGRSTLTMEPVSQAALSLTLAGPDAI
jgi:predicted double-glycine peptidase